jgi:hypothetical protein
MVELPGCVSDRDDVFFVIVGTAVRVVLVNVIVWASVLDHVLDRKISVTELVKLLS